MSVHCWEGYRISTPVGTVPAGRVHVQYSMSVAFACAVDAETFVYKSIDNFSSHPVHQGGTALHYPSCVVGITSCIGGGRRNMPPLSVTLTFELLTLKVRSESRVTWAIFVPVLVFLGLSVLDLGPMYATDVRQTDVRQHHRLMPPPRGRGHT